MGLLFEVCYRISDMYYLSLSLSFHSRLKSNIRFILSFPDLSFTHQSGILKRKNLLSVVNISYQLPWDRKELLHVANYHLKGKTEFSKWHNVLSNLKYSRMFIT